MRCAVAAGAGAGRSVAVMTGRRWDGDLGKVSKISGLRPAAGRGRRGDRGRVAGQIPARYRVKPGDTVALMECRNTKCRAPFDPASPVPRDRLCRECRRHQREETPVLPGLEDLD